MLFINKMALKYNNKDTKITFRITPFQKIVLEQYLSKNHIQNKSEAIRKILFKTLLQQS